MIFYDRKQIRKRFLHIITGITFVFLSVLIGLLIWALHTETSSQHAGSITNKEGIYLALTFDDGPHPVYTPAILEVLQEKEVPATFFFIGNNMLKHPDVVRQVHNAGYTIGNHTFTHSENVHASKERMRIELELTNQVIQHITGERARFYRAPFLDDFGDANQEFITQRETPSNQPVDWVNELGYVGVSAYIDPRDWAVKDASTLIARVLERTEYGNIILLHDGGRQRQATLEALPFIIDELRAQGFVLVSLDELSGIAPYVTPPATKLGTFSNHLNISVLGTIYTKFIQFVLGATILVLICCIARLILVILSRFFPRPKKPKPYQGGVSVLIPAYNEERNIEATIASVLKSTHEEFEIIVVDDGSTDGTKEAVARASKNTQFPVQYVYKENGGKASALNAAIELAQHEVLVAIDSDSFVHPDALAHLASHFNDPEMGAVAGKVSAITSNRLLGWFQDIEYTVSQNIEKEAFNIAFGSINVIPGAIGAWRRSAVLEAQGYSGDTQVEDQDLTLAIHALHYKVRYDRCAVAYTEVPSTIKAFVKQRFRWMFGTLQCLWKYKKYLCHADHLQLGWVILPYGIVFSLITPLLMPVIDGLLIYALISGNWLIPLLAFVTFTVIDLIYHAIGLTSEPKKLLYLPLIPIQRMFFRLVFSYIAIKSIIYALEGTRTYWAAQLRTGSAQALFLKHQANS